MKKISTLFKKDPTNLALVVNEINPVCEWVFTDGARVKPTKKYDGTAAAIIDGKLYKRYDVKKGRQIPEGAIPCQEPDEVTGHHPHWVECKRDNPEDRYFWEGYDRCDSDYLSWLEYSWKKPMTFELCGPKVQGNPEGFLKHHLIEHGATELHNLILRSYDYLKEYLTNPDNNIEGIVFHHDDGRMCKIRKSDFGIKRQPLVVSEVNGNLTYKTGDPYCPLKRTPTPTYPSAT